MTLTPGFVSAGGLWANLITGCLALLILTQPKLTSKPLRCFLWLFATFSLMVSVNLFVATLAGVGDWAQLTGNLEPTTIRKWIGIGGGALLVILGFLLPIRIWMPRLKGNLTAQAKVTLIPVAALMAIQTLAVLATHTLRLPRSANLLLGPVFGYPVFLLWVLLVNLIPAPRSTRPPESIELMRSRRWWAVGGAALVAALAASALLVIRSGIAQRYQVPPAAGDGWKTAT
jgi:hypothetical protein